VITPHAPGGYVLDDQVGYLLRVASQRHVAIFQDHAPDGLTPTQFSALIRIGELGTCSQNHLGRMISVDVATIKGVVDRLKRKGLVQLASDPKDKRRTVISLTEPSKSMIAGLQQAGHRISDETLHPLTEEERQALVQLLRRLG